MFVFRFTETSCFGKNAVSTAIAPINPQNNTVSNISLFLAIISPLRNGNTGTDYSFDLPVTLYKAQSQPHKMQFPTRPYTFYPLISNTCSSISEVTPLPSPIKIGKYISIVLSVSPPIIPFFNVNILVKYVANCPKSSK